MERLNKYLAHAGLGSRRACEGLITTGRVKINGTIVRDLATQVDPEVDKVHVDDTIVRVEKLAYWAVHKPPGYLCTNHDPSGRPLAIELIPHVEQRVYTVGRLDEASEGLLLMTNDGDLAHKLTHPRFEIEKTYLVLVAGSPSKQDLDQLLEGVWLSDGKVKAKRIKKLKMQGDSTWLRIVLSEGKNREIRRMLAKLRHKVLNLRRIAIGTIQLDRLPRGKSRKLTGPEIADLKQLAEGSVRKIQARITRSNPRAPEARPGSARPARSRPPAPRSTKKESE